MLISIIEIDYLISYQLCMTWLNWSGLKTIPHLTLTHNTQDFDSTNAYLICVIVHVQMWCVCSNTCWSNPKRFLSVLFVFESDFILLCLMFLFKIFFLCFSSKIVLKVVSREARDLELPAKCVLKGNYKVTFFIQKVSLLPREYFATKLFSRNVFRQKLEIFQVHTKAITTVSQLKASRESFSVSRD